MSSTGAVRIQEMEYLNMGEARDEVTCVCCILRECSKEPAAHTSFGANTLERFAAKFWRGILSKQAFGKWQGFPWRSAGSQQHAHRVPNCMCCSLWCDWHPPGDSTESSGAGGKDAGWWHQSAAGCPRGFAVLSPAATLDKRDGIPRSLPANAVSDRPQLYLITN